jgi:parvulin-like peptidyl-prolyl isomerase
MTQKTAVLAFVLVLAAAAAVTVAVPRAEILEQVLVKVNGEIFTKTELEARQVITLRAKGQAMDLKTDPSNAALRKALDEITPGIMVDAVNEMVIVQRGKELGYRLSDEQFKGVVDSIRKENKIETEEQFQAALKTEGMTMTDLRHNLERNMIRQKVEQNEVLSKIGITESESRAYYAAHLQDFTTPQTVTLREILVAVASVAGEPAAQARAAEIRKRVTTGGENFEKVVTDMSDSPSKANGGLIGPISLQDVSPDLRKSIEAMKQGDISPVIRNARGFQVLKLETLSQSQTTPFDAAHDKISDAVFAEKRKGETLKYLDKLRTQAIIEWKNQELKKAFEEGLKQLQ